MMKRWDLNRTGKRFFKEESGATAMEYGLIIALLALAIITAVSNIGDGINGGLEKANKGLKDANS
ncbi:MAG: Flp family type IVb pilin [Pseudomonadota bacterium]